MIEVEAKGGISDKLSREDESNSHSIAVSHLLPPHTMTVFLAEELQGWCLLASSSTSSTVATLGAPSFRFTLRRSSSSRRRCWSSLLSLTYLSSQPPREAPSRYSPLPASIPQQFLRPRLDDGNYRLACSSGWVRGLWSRNHPLWRPLFSASCPWLLLMSKVSANKAWTAPLTVSIDNRPPLPVSVLLTLFTRSVDVDRKDWTRRLRLRYGSRQIVAISARSAVRHSLNPFSFVLR